MCHPAMIVATTVGSALTNAMGNRAASQARKDSLAMQAQIARHNQQIAQERIKDTRRVGKQAEFDHRRKIKQTVGAQKAALASQGIDLSFGTPAELMSDTDIIGEFDVGTIRDNTKRRVFEHQINEYNARANAQLLQFSSDQEKPDFAFANTLLGSAARLGSNNNFMDLVKKIGS